MAKFVQRTEAPTEDNAYYYANNPFYQSGYGLPNCTCYAWGRFYEISGSKPSLSLSDAENWYGYSDGYERGSVPKLGAVICWRKGEVGVNSDGAGHVAIVEAINDDGSIVTSESGWNDSRFWWTRTRSNDGNWGYTTDQFVFQGFIYNPVSFDGSTTDRPNSRYIWDYFVAKIGNEYGVAGLMGNLDAESGLYPDRIEGDIPYSDASKEYTADVDSGAISESDFVNSGSGYGLAQWTYSARKQALYDMYESGGYSSIGAIDLACDYLWYELQTSFPTVLAVLRSATSVREASDKVLHDFENPLNQDESVEIERAAMGQVYFDLYHGSTPTPDGKKKKGLSLLLMWAATRR